MIGSLLKKIFGTNNERLLKKIIPAVERINALEEGISALTDQQLKHKTVEFRDILTKGTPLDDILDEAFAVVREVSKRTLGFRHFDVQLIGGIVLHQGNIAEMKTGEGKTLSATLPVYLNAIDGRGVHVVTVNDYLARRDAQWMGPIYDFLGLTIGIIQHEKSYLFDTHSRSHDKNVDMLRSCSKQEAYGADITYGTNNEYGFDYLRDNMKYDINDYCQRELNYAIVDEVDSILIDEARTPLIISGASEESTDKYYKINRIIPKLIKDKDFTIEEKTKNIILTEEGGLSAEKLIGVENLFDPENIELVHHVLQGLKAHHLFRKDVDYVIKDDEIIIVDEFTGRLMPGRRWSDGLHQAVEAKEGVKIENENQTLASITFQNFFRMYNKLAGMTGTAETEASEFAKIYNLDVIVIPTNQPMVRIDNSDYIYKSEKAKFDAAVKEIEECHKRGQPVLVGTISIEKSEHLHSLLKAKKITHSVLNAKYHDKEAEIVAQAGRFNAVTIATNMAGRGTDIVLGGNPAGIARDMLKEKSDYTDQDWTETLKKAEILCAEERQKVLVEGGLHILATERHEARRIDNQLRGRSGRQGDVGSSRFYLSLEDDLMRIFGSEKISGLMDRFGMEEDIPIENMIVTRAIENAQKRVEGHNFDIRKHLLEYDDVMNKQRIEIYSFRQEILREESLKNRIDEMILDIVDEVAANYCPDGTYRENWELEPLCDSLFATFGISKDRVQEKISEITKTEDLRNSLDDILKEHYKEREKEFGTEFMRVLEKNLLLQILDTQWKDHLLAMDHLKEGIGLRGYGQKDPLVEYKKEGFNMFEDMTFRIMSEFLNRLFHIQVQTDEAPKIRLEAKRPPAVTYNRGDSAPQPIVKKGRKVGRNDPCPCGSGKKNKKCCGL
ncbi:MAG: preprotein translocase subunit SecA [Nitrospirae bacterium]|nr:preprotein translocase subunit SecA [Nitrospirota bacterium]